MLLKKLSSLFAVFCLFLTLSTTYTNSAIAAKHTVEIKGMEFSPKTLTIKAGDKVKFINKDTAPPTQPQQQTDAFKAENSKRAKVKWSHSKKLTPTLIIACSTPQ